MASSHYVGKAGQIAVMAELAWRGYNVSIPEIDVGDDVFVLNDFNGKLSRIQVKTATGKELARTKGAYSCQFSINITHLNGSNSGTHYIFVCRCGKNWRFLIFKRFVLANLIKAGLGTKIRNRRMATVNRRMVTVIFFNPSDAGSNTKNHTLSKHASRWSIWPKLPGGADSN